jgi:VCBS repeat-containing protein
MNASTLIATDSPGAANESTQTLMLSGVSGTSQRGGTVQLTAGTLTYTPPADFNGMDSFTYTVVDNGQTDGLPDPQSANGTVEVSVNAVNDPPQAVDDAYAGSEDAVLLVAGTGVLDNDFDIDLPADTLTVANPGPRDTTSGAIATLNASGTFEYDPTGSATLQAMPAGASIVDTFTYQVWDGQNTSNTATVSIRVSGANDPPQATPDSYTVQEDVAYVASVAEGLLSNDQDPEGSTLSAVRVSGPVNGVLVLRSDGSFTYTPKLDFVGTDTFVYRASDGALNSVATTVTFTVEGANDPPIAEDDEYTLAGASLVVSTGQGVLANDLEPDNQTMTARLIGDVDHGLLVLNNNGSFTYTPDSSFSGVDTFTYQAVDEENLASDVVTVSISVESNFPWQNSPNALDVNDDGDVSAIDALQIINDLNDNGSRALPDPPVNPPPPPPFLDVNGDGSISPADALVVINFLNAGNGEGEAPVGATVRVAVADTFPEAWTGPSAPSDDDAVAADSRDAFFADFEDDEPLALAEVEPAVAAPDQQTNDDDTDDEIDADLLDFLARVWG